MAAIPSKGGTGGGLDQVAVEGLIDDAIAGIPAGPKGDPGAPGAPGKDGVDGVGAAPLEWRPLPLAAGASAFGAPYGDPEYAVTDDFVYFRGLIAIGTAAITLATLPEDARPSEKRAWTTGGANATSETYLGVLETDGTFKLVGVVVPGAGPGLPILDDLHIAR